MGGVRRVLFPLVAVGSLALARSSEATLNSNLIVNPGAESDVVTVPAGGVVPTLTGWTRTGNLTAVKYDTTDFITSTDPGPIDRGANFFAGGPSSSSSSATQTISVSDETVRIDGGLLKYNLSGYFGGYLSQQDYAILRAQFRDGSDAVLGTASVGGDNASSRGGATGLLLDEKAGAVPVGTRSVVLTLEMTRAGGSYNDGYADNLVFSFQSVPEASTAILFGLGLAPLVLHRRKAM